MFYTTDPGESILIFPVACSISKCEIESKTAQVIRGISMKTFIEFCIKYYKHHIVTASPFVFVRNVYIVPFFILARNQELRLGTEIA